MFRRSLWFLRRTCHKVAPREFLGYGLAPIAVAMDGKAGQPIHRYYLENFIRKQAADIQGHCLEFQDSFYSSRFGGDRISKLDIINIDDSAPEATIVADLTQENVVPSNQFDCIICTHVLDMVEDLDRFMRELHRILRPEGVLLIAVPHILYDTTLYGELWRFTPLGIRKILSKRFSEDDFIVECYGNSLAAAGDIRGLAAAKFSRKELDHFDPRFVIEICARVTKGAESSQSAQLDSSAPRLEQPLFPVLRPGRLRVPNKIQTATSPPRNLQIVDTPPFPEMLSLSTRTPPEIHSGYAGV